MAADSVRLAVATGRTQRAESVVSATDHLARRTGVALYEGVALRCRGLHERDIVTLGDAVHALCRSERPMDLAAAREDIGRELGRAGRVQEAHPLLEEALATYERVGAAWDTTRADALLRSLGLCSVGEADVAGVGDCCGPVVDSELGEDVRDMVADRLVAQVQAFSD